MPSLAQDIFFETVIVSVLEQTGGMGWGEGLVNNLATSHTVSHSLLPSERAK